MFSIHQKRREKGVCPVIASELFSFLLQNFFPFLSSGIERSRGQRCSTSSSSKCMSKFLTIQCKANNHCFSGTRMRVRRVRKNLQTSIHRKRISPFGATQSSRAVRSHGRSLFRLFLSRPRRLITRGRLIWKYRTTTDQ